VPPRGRKRRQRADELDLIVPSVATFSVSGVRCETLSSIAMNCVSQEARNGSARSFLRQAMRSGQLYWLPFCVVAGITEIFINQ
jgi:hypothetical protein